MYTFLFMTMFLSRLTKMIVVHIVHNVINQLTLEICTSSNSSKRDLRISLAEFLKLVREEHFALC